MRLAGNSSVKLAGYPCAWVALVASLWRMLMDSRLDALAEAKATGDLDERLRAQHCR